MKRTTYGTPLAVAMLLLAGMGQAYAKVSAEEAAKLGTELTCVGAEKAGNKDGTIPAYTGKWLGTPPGIEYKPNVGQKPVDPYASEKPLYIITAENMSQHAEHLTDGQKAMFAKYPKTFKIPVYPGHRDFRYDDAVCAAIKKNAVNAELIDGGMGMKNTVYGAVAFPIPKNGYEVLWNHTLPTRASSESTIRDAAVVNPSGNVVWGRQNNRNLSVFNDPKRMGKPVDLNVQAYSSVLTMLPAREKGGVSVSQEPMNFATGKRLAWSYDPGTRRVRQVPEYGFDQPIGGTSGMLMIDEDRLFNGSPERFNFKLLGKKEIYIPANTYKLHAEGVKYADLIKPGHANPDFLRYELRRVWVVEADLKEGFRHLYKKRVLFFDEDTWHAVMADNYDARGQLWKHAELNYYYAFDMHAWQAGTSFYYDLNSGGYVGYNLFQEAKLGPVLNKANLTPEDFTPEAARAMGN
ncbi:hypothetical protein PTE30175_04689 [Pandoraea terrae]|uniref:Sigma E regulatory protein, MucB/RseB n=1 Tax=Pandoraea terrae TaxID=1537710 RepID=A0A5E4YW34_9BURK|nr:DUF1329 domain-containing protein [Pandoraea terrae]VVE52525.1 hypothetical protein PTE30175_04689 [Pandoraea terrae]